MVISLLSQQINNCVIGLDARNATVEQLRTTLGRVEGNMESMERQLNEKGFDVRVRHNNNV